MIATKLKAKLYPSKTLRQKNIEGNVAFESFDNDPFFQVIPESKIIHAGWYVINYSFTLLKGEVLLPKVYFDFGDGFSEAYHWKLFYNNNEIFGLVKVPWNCYKIRLDLSEKNIDFEHGTFSIKRVSKAHAVLHLFTILDKLGESRSHFFKELMGKKGFSNKKKLLKSLSEGSYLTLDYQKVPIYENSVAKSEPTNNIQELLSYSSIDDSKLQNLIYNKEKIVKPSVGVLNGVTVDIVLPVYNGLQYLEKLIPQLVENSDVPFNLHIIDDCSTDVGVPLFLNNVRYKHSNINVYTNEVNLGFTKTVNKLLKLCTNDIIVLLNSDIEVPAGWLSRLVAPMVADKKIGTITPISNCATICSFPNMGDNALLEGYDVDTINAPLLEMGPYFEEIPTGVGFCMVINNPMLQKIGLLNEEAFPRGYGEENDLCFRARKNGFSNVLNTNLFVYHKHGGSFASEEKLKLMQENQQKLESLHPDFTPELQKYFKTNTFILIKLVYFLKLIQKENKKLALFLDHDLGGGTNTYSKNYHQEHDTHAFLYGKYINPNRNPNKQILFSLTYRNYQFSFGIDDLKVLFDLLTHYNIRLDEIIINNVVSYNNAFETVESCLKYKGKYSSKLIVLCHDFFYICPNFLLFRENTEFCHVPADLSVCSRCLSKLSESIDPKLIPNDFTTLVDWRRQWETLLVKQADEVIAFSESTKALFVKVWPALSQKVQVRPHKLQGFKKHTEGFIRIGILGSIHSVAKGAKFVQELASYVYDEKLNNIKLISIGNIHPNYDHNIIEKTGPYNLDDLHFTLLKNKIDVVLIPSVCSETFSFTTREAIEAGLPTACFNFGGQYDQVKNYDKGIVVEQIEPEAVIKAIKRYFKSNS